MSNRVVSVELRAQVSQYVAGLKQAAQATTDLAGKAGKTLTDHSAEVSRMGTGFAVAGAGMLLVAGKAVKTFADFDQAMSGVAATGEDAKQSLGGLRELAVQLGADTQYSAQEAAEGITNLLKAGVSAQDVIGGGLAGSLNLAAAGQMAVADAAETTAITLSQFGLSGSQASHVADLLAAGAGKASGEVSDMAMALSQAGLVANQTGLTVEETTGALAAFGKAGLIGSDAGTSLKTMLQRLTPQSKEAQKQFDQLGISAYDANGQFVGMANFAGQLQDKLGKLTPQARNAALGVMFGSDAIRAANVLYSEGATGIQTWIDAVNEQGYASRQAAQLTDNLAGDVERLGGSLDSVFIKSGSGANDFLRRLVQGAEAAVDAVGGLPEPLLSTMALLTGAGGIASIGVGGLLKVAAAAADAKANFAALSVSARTAKLAVAGFGGAFAVGALALTVWADSQAQLNATAADFASTLVVVNGQVTSTSATIDMINDKLAQTQTLFGFGPTLLDLMNQVGVSAKDAQGYLIGEAAAVDRVNAAMAAYTRENPFTASMQTAPLQRGLDDLSRGLSEAERRTLQKSQADQEAAGSAGNLSSALREQQTGADSAAASIQKVTEAIYGLQDANLAITSSEVAFEQAIDDSRTAVDKLLKSTKDRKRLQDIDTQAGRDALTTLTSLAAKTNDYVKARIKQGSSEREITSTMARGRRAFAERARDLGFTEQRVAELIGTYLQVPENVQTDVNESGSDGAKARVSNLMQAIDGLPKATQTRILSEFNNHGIAAAEAALARVNGRTATTYVRTIHQVYGPKGGRQFTAEADGGMLRPTLAGLIQEFAAGGFGQPQIRPFQGADGVRWGEEGSGPWEAFISGAPQKRDRSIAIWKEVGRKLLGNFSAEELISQFADGGIKEPTHKGKPLSFWQDKLKTPLELTRLRLQIRDLKHDLKEKESYGKGKIKKKRLKLRGLDRTEARQQLKESEKEYDWAVEAGKLNKSKKGSIASQVKAWEKSRDAADDAAQFSEKWQQQFMQGASAADLLANMQAGAQQIAEFNTLMGKLGDAGLSKTMKDWLWDQGPGASQVAKDILAGGKAGIDAFNKASGNLGKAADAAGKSAGGTQTKSPVLDRMEMPGYMKSGINGASVGGKQVTFNMSQLDPQSAAVYIDQQLRYL